MEKEVNCINCKAILEYTKVHNNGDFSELIRELDPEIDTLDDPVSFLMNSKNWVSTSIVAKLLERARIRFGNENIAFEIARFLAEQSYFEEIHLLFTKSFWTYKEALKNIQKINDQYNRNKRVELFKVKRNQAIVRLHWNPDIKASKDLCLYNQGNYTFMPKIWRGKPLTLSEKCCSFEGAPYCEYHLRYPIMNKFFELSNRIFTPKSTLMDTIEKMEADKKIIEKQYEEVNRLNIELQSKMMHLLAAQETAKAILSVLNLEELLDTILNILSDVCQINRAIIMLVNEKNNHLEFMYGTGFEGDIPEEIKNYSVDLSRVSNILIRVTNTGCSEYISNVDKSSLRKENILLAYGRPTSLYVVPLITRLKVIGIIATDAVEDKGVPKVTRDTMEIFSPQIAIAIENARYYQRLEKQMIDIENSYELLSRAEKFSFLGNLASRLADEIEEPMTTITSFIKMLPDKFDDEDFRDHFHTVALEEIKRVNDLISELLSMVKSSDSQFEYNDIHGLIDKMILIVSPQSNAKNIKMIRKYDPDVSRLWMDSEKMKQVILNIISNAVEFTPENGKIEVSTRLMNSMESDYINVEIKDTGIGIAENHINRIFDPYYTTKYDNSMTNGTGLGLFIAHKNVEEHGGRIEVKSTVNKGTTFIIRIPIMAPQDLQ